MTDFESAFHDVAERLARDVMPLASVTTEVAEMPARRLADQAMHFSRRGYFDKVIRLFVAGEWCLDLTFLESQPFDEQVLNGLSQFQDCIAEAVGEPWPTCPQHYHMMVEDMLENEFVWRCPDNPTIVSKLGFLNS
jgi:hypothetical protein